MEPEKSVENELNSGKMPKKMRGLKDLVLSMLGLVAMNGVIQLLLYPSISKALGEDAFGDVLSMLAVVSVLATAIGTGVNYARMVAETKGRSANGEFNLFLFISMIYVAGISVGASVLILKEKGVLFNVLFIVLSVLSVLRYYGDVEFRLKVNFFRFFVYYVLIAIGYVGGSFLVRFNVFGGSYSWVIAIILGEALAVGFVCVTGDIFRGRNVLKPSPFAKENVNTAMFLLATNLINALALQGDKILLQIFRQGSDVTVFYVATLVGKIVALLTTPLNGVIIGYLARYKGKFTKKFFATATLIAVVVMAVFTAGSVLASHIFVRLIYPDIYANASPYFIFANAGQIVYFTAGTMMVIVLRFVHEKYQLIINTGYAVLFVAALVPLTMYGGIWGITWGLLGVNAVRFIAVVILGFAHTDRDKPSIDETANETPIDSTEIQ